MAGIETGTVFGGRYVVRSQVGTGGMATVYRGDDTVLDRTVAIKVMLPQYANDPAFAQRFKQEAQAAAALQNPYIVQVYDWGRDTATSTYYIVMEYLRGTDLKTGIRSHGALAPRKVAQIGAQVCSALSVAHAHDIIHRDIKPQNIMIQPNGDAKVMDFGIARAKNSHLTQTNSVLGTAHYVSPEQAQGKELGPTSDLYSLGVVMYEAATGKLPFDGEDAVSVALKQVNEYAVPPSQVNPNVDDALEAIIMRCMSKDPRQRFQTADELRRVLNSYINGKPTGVPAYNGAGMGGTATTRLGGGSGTTSLLGGETGRTSSMRPGQTGTVRMTRETERIAGMNGMGGLGAMNAGGARGAAGQTGGARGQQRGGRGVSGGVIAGIVVGVLVVVVVVAVIALNSCGTTQQQGTTTDTAADQGSTTTQTTTEQVTIPDVSGLTQTEATSRLTALGLKVSGVSEENSSTVDKGKVIRTTPAANSQTATGTIVSVVVSKGPANVSLPTLTKGMSENDLVNALKSAGFTAQHDSSLDAYDTDTANPAAEGTFLTLDPTVANSTSGLAKGSTVKYGLSKGPNTVTVPTGFYNISVDEARSKLEAAGISVYGTVESGYDDNVAAGYVTGIDEVEGSQIQRDGNGQAWVTLFISSGPQPITVQDYSGWSVSAAQSGIANAGLTVNYVDTTTAAPSTDLAGTVISTSPAAGSQVSRGTSVVIYAYGDYVAPTPTPTPAPDSGDSDTDKTDGTDTSTTTDEATTTTTGSES